jgi:hypothetical protein
MAAPTDILAARLAALPADAVVALMGALEGKQPFEPLPGPQTAAYESLADELLYGVRRGGKTQLLIGNAATAHKRSLILRRQSTELDGLIAELTAVLGAEGYNKNDHEHTAGGRSIKLGGCREPEDWRAYAGRARDMLGFDEAGEFLEEQVSSLIAWNRSIDPKQRCRVILASNPPRSADGEWLMRWFEPWLDPGFADPAKPGELRWFVRARGETVWSTAPAATRLTAKPTLHARAPLSRRGSATILISTARNTALASKISPSRCARISRAIHGGPRG